MIQPIANAIVTHCYTHNYSRTLAEIIMDDISADALLLCRLLFSVISDVKFSRRYFRTREGIGIVHLLDTAGKGFFR